MENQVKKKDANCECPNTADIDALLPQVTSPNSYTDRKTALGWAVHQQDVALVETLIKKGAKVNNCWHEGDTPLEDAIKSGNKKITFLLLEAGADTIINGGRALFYATQKKDLRLMRILVDKGSVVSLDTIFHCIREADLASLEVLLPNISKINNVKRNEGQTPLQYAVKMQNLKVVRWLLDHGAQYSIPKALVDALTYENFDITRLLLSRADHLNFTYKDGDTILFKAIAGGDVAIVAEILKHQVDVDRPNQKGNTPLVYSIQQNEPEMALLLLHHDANPNLADRDGNAPLVTAIKRHQSDVVKNLLERRVDTNVTDSDGNSPLTLALNLKQKEITNLMLLRGFPHSYTPASLLFNCIAQNNVEAVTFLLKSKVELNHFDAEGYTPLTSSVQWGRYEMVKALVNNGAKVDQVDNRGRSAVVLAVRSQNYKVLDFLLLSGSKDKIVGNELSRFADTNDDLASCLDSLGNFSFLST